MLLCRLPTAGCGAEPVRLAEPNLARPPQRRAPGIASAPCSDLVFLRIEGLPGDPLPATSLTSPLAATHSSCRLVRCPLPAATPKYSISDGNGDLNDGAARSATLHGLPSGVM